MIAQFLVLWVWCIKTAMYSMFLSSCVQPQDLTFGIGTENRSLSHQRKDGTRSAISHRFKFRFLYLFAAKLINCWTLMCLSWFTLNYANNFWFMIPWVCVRVCTFLRVLRKTLYQSDKGFLSFHVFTAAAFLWSDWLCGTSKITHFFILQTDACYAIKRIANMSLKR